MKPLLLSLLLALFSTTCVLADSPEAILKDYQKQSAAALTKLNGTLEQSATPLIATLIKAGDTAAAEQLTAQLKAKLAGEPVPTPQASATLLFAQYDQARAKALEPAQKAAVARIDTLLSGKEGKNLEMVTVLGKVRVVIEGGKAGAAAAPPDFPMSWNYYTGADKSRLVGELLLSADGTLSLNTLRADGTPFMTGNPPRPAGDSGRWERLKKDVVKINLTTPGKEEEFEMIISGKNAVLKRAVGDRFLTAR